MRVFLFHVPSSTHSSRALARSQETSLHRILLVPPHGHTQLPHNSMPLAPALVQNSSQEWCTVSRRDASGTLVPIDGGQVVFSQNLHVLVQLPTNFDYTSLPLVVRRQSAVQSGSTQHGFVSAKHHGHKLVFTSHPYGKPNASAAITVELTRNAGPACPLSRSSSDPLASYETDSEIAM